MEDQSLGASFPSPWKRGGEVSGVWVGRAENKHPPLHLAAGSWDRGQEGPICHPPVLPGCWAGTGGGGQPSGLGPLRPGWEWGHFKRVGSLGILF